MSGSGTNDALLKSYFDLSDVDKSGRISAQELQQCLGTGSRDKKFCMVTVRLLIGLFCGEQQSVGFEEFKQLWLYVSQWQEVFVAYCASEQQQQEKTHRRSDSYQKRKHKLNVEQVHSSLVNSGLKLSFESVQKLLQRVRASPLNDEVDFDDYIHVCILVQKLTRVFNKHDPQQIGIATFEYDGFITRLFDLLESALKLNCEQQQQQQE